MNFKEKKRYFINECKQREFMIKMIIEIDEKLEKEKDEESRKELLEKRNYFVYRVNCIDSTLMNVIDPVCRNAIRDKFILGFSKTKTAKRNSISEGNLYPMIDRSIKKIL